MLLENPRILCMCDRGFSFLSRSLDILSALLLSVLGASAREYISQRDYWDFSRH